MGSFAKEKHSILDVWQGYKYAFVYNSSQNKINIYLSFHLIVRRSLSVILSDSSSTEYPCKIFWKINFFYPTRW